MWIRQGITKAFFLRCCSNSTCFPLLIQCFARHKSCVLGLPVVQVYVLLGFANIVLENDVN